LPGDPIVSGQRRNSSKAIDLLAHRSDRGEYPDIAIVPIAAETAASRQFVVAEPFSAKIPDSHAAAKVEEGIVRTDAHSAGVLVTPLGQQVCWQMGENMLFDVPADQLRDLRPPPFRQGIERIVWLFVLGHSSPIRRGNPTSSLTHAVQQGDASS